MSTKYNEYEIVDYNHLRNIKLFIVDLVYRNLHMHNEYELCLLLNGSLEVYTCKNLSLHQVGDLFLFNPSQPHELRAKDNSNVMILSLQVSQRFFSPYYKPIENLDFMNYDISHCCSRNECVRLKNCLFTLAKIYFEKPAYYELLCISQIAEIFYSLVKLIPIRILSENEKINKRNMNKRLSNILSYIDMHYAGKILLSDIAEKEGLSLSYLSHYFKDYLGLSFQEYIKLLRFREALRLVEQTSMNMTDIYLTCGFSDIRHMNHMFKEQLGCTPREYRAHSNNNNKQPYKERQSSTIQRFLSVSESISLLEKMQQR
jgi:AraC-like DNA-binding protein